MKVGPMKSFILSEFQINGKTFSIPLVHLTSDKAQSCIETRTKQLKNLFTTQTSPSSLLMGDFNFGDGSEQDSFKWGEYQDIWLNLRPNEQGFTFDPDKNTIAHITSASKKSKRIDRMILRSEDWVPKKIEMFAQECWTIQHQEADVVLFPSDHFGLKTTLIIKEKGTLSNK